jgi:hypothetical protein
MMPLHIHGIGVCAMGHDEPFADGIGRMADIPIKDHAKPAARRRYGQVTRMIYVAAARSLADAGVQDPSALAVVSSTAMGEVNVSLDLIEQIHRTRGALISPSLVPNAVHNAPAGHLTIGIANRQPSVTVSQGWLSAEAAIAAAADILAVGATDRVLAVIGDEADPGWASRLEGAGASSWGEDLRAEGFQEGGVALVLGLRPGGRNLGIVAAAVERGDGDRAREVAASLAGTSPEIRLRVGAGAAELERALPGAVVDGPGIGTSQIGAAAVLLDRMRDPACDSLLLFGREVDDLGWLHWTR